MLGNWKDQIYLEQLVLENSEEENDTLIRAHVVRGIELYNEQKLKSWECAASSYMNET